MNARYTVMGIKTSLAVIEQCMQILRQCSVELADGLRKEELVEALKTADESLRLAKSEIAKGFNFPICRKHFPPGIMVKSKLEGELEFWRCSDCGTIVGDIQVQQEPFPSPDAN